MDLCEFRTTLGYTRWIQKRIQVVVAHIFNPSVWVSHNFNPSTREVETGVIWLGRERTIKGKTGTSWSVESKDSCRQDLALLVEIW